MFNATTYGPSCVQSRTNEGDHKGTKAWTPPNEISEDCLYLNLWVPKEQPKKPLTTMVRVLDTKDYHGKNIRYPKY